MRAQTELQAFQITWLLENTSWTCFPRGKPPWMSVQAAWCPSAALSAAFSWDLLDLCPHDPNPPTVPASSSFGGMWTVVLGGNTLKKCWSHFTIPPCFEYSRFTPVFPLSNFPFPTWPVCLGNRSSDLNFLQVTRVKYFYFFGEIAELYQSSSSPPKTAPQHYRQHDTSQDGFVYLQFLYHKYYFSFSCKPAYALEGFQLNVSLVKHKREFLPSHPILLETMSGKHQPLHSPSIYNCGRSSFSRSHVTMTNSCNINYK